MKSKLKTRVICGIIAAALLTVNLGVTPIFADDSYQVLMNIQNQIDDAVEYSIVHPEQVQPEPKQPDPWCGYYGYPYWGWGYCYYDKCAPWYYSGPSDIVINVGETYQINIGPGGGDFQSTNPAVASVNGNGLVSGNGEGTCAIKVIGYQGGFAMIRVRVNGTSKSNNNNNNNQTVVYVQQPVYNAATTNASWLGIANNLVLNAGRNSTVNLSSAAPLSLDATFANILRLRPDVTVNVTYGFNGHTFLLTIPKGYNLASKLNAAGTVDFVTLSNVVDGKIRCKLLY